MIGSHGDQRQSRGVPIVSRQSARVGGADVPSYRMNSSTEIRSNTSFPIVSAGGDAPVSAALPHPTSDARGDARDCRRRVAAKEDERSLLHRLRRPTRTSYLGPTVGRDTKRGVRVGSRQRHVGRGGTDGVDANAAFGERHALGTIIARSFRGSPATAQAGIPPRSAIGDPSTGLVIRGGRRPLRAAR